MTGESNGLPTQGSRRFALRSATSEAWREPAVALEVLGLPFLLATADDALVAIERACDTKAGAVSVAFVNSHGLNLAYEDTAYRAVLRGFDFRLGDGVGVSLAALLKGERTPENLNGNDFSPDLLRLAVRRGWSVFLLGGRPGVAERAARKLVSDTPGLVIAGTQHGYFPLGSSSDIADRIRLAGAELLLVCLGNPAQEQWLADNLERTGARLGTGVGAFLDIMAGDVPRAPRWMTRYGVEWAHRLAHEPRRLWRRYLIGIPLFVARILWAELPGGDRRRDRHG